MPDITLKEYVDNRFYEMRVHYDARLTDNGKAAVREIAVLDERLDKMNHIYGQLTLQYTQFNTQLTGYMMRDEYNARHEALLVDIKRIEELFQRVPTMGVFDALRIEVRKLIEWQANMTGRIWAIGVLIAVVSVLVQIVLHIFRAPVG